MRPASERGDRRQTLAVRHRTAKTEIAHRKRIALAERAQRHGFPESQAEEKRTLAAVMRRVAQQLGNTPAVSRASYVSPAVIDQYLEGRTIENFRPRHLRVVGAREIGLDAEERALLSLLRSWRIRQSRAAA